jgi:hypothetical protein
MGFVNRYRSAQPEYVFPQKKPGSPKVLSGMNVSIPSFPASGLGIRQTNKTRPGRVLFNGITIETLPVS